MSFHTGRAQELVSYLNSDELRRIGKNALGTIDEAADVFDVQGMLSGGAGLIPKGMGRDVAVKAAKGAIGKNIGRAIPVLGAAQSVVDVGDIVFGDESAGNKIMDGTAMAIGGTIGGVLGMGNPILAAAGASTGKWASDTLQYIFGDKKTPEQRKMEEALAALQGRYI